MAMAALVARLPPAISRASSRICRWWSIQPIACLSEARTPMPVGEGRGGAGTPRRSAADPAKLAASTAMGSHGANANRALGQPEDWENSVGVLWVPGAGLEPARLCEAAA